MTSTDEEIDRLVEWYGKDSEAAAMFRSLKVRAKAAEKQIAEFKVDADPVAWQNRYRSRSGPSEEWSEWSEWRDGKQPELRTKAEDEGCYDTEERPLYTRPDPKLAEAAEELLRLIDDQDYGDLPDELKGRIRAVLGREP